MVEMSDNVIVCNLMLYIFNHRKAIPVKRIVATTGSFESTPMHGSFRVPIHL